MANIRNAFGGIVLASLLSLAVAGSLNDQGDALVKEYDALKGPVYTPDIAKDEAKSRAYQEAFQAYLQKQHEIALKLYRVDPNHPRTVDLLFIRWFTLFTCQNANVELPDADIDAVLKDRPRKEIAELGEMMKVLARMWRNQPDFMNACDAYFEKYPNGGEAPRFMAYVAELSPAKRVPVYESFLKRCPRHPIAPTIRGAIRQVRAVGKPFALKFTDAITGRLYDIADHRNKIVIVDFWATWCGPCKSKMPALKRLLDKYRDQGVEVVGVSLDEPEKAGGLTALRKFIAETGYPWPQYYQGDGAKSKFSANLGIIAIPNVFIIDPQGILRETGVRNMEAAVERLLKEFLERSNVESR